MRGMGFGFVLTVGLIACGRAAEVPAPCLAVPEASQVERVSVTRWTGGDAWAGKHAFADRARIERLLAALRSQPSEGCFTLERKRVQELTVAFDGTDDVPLVLWIGADWIGGVDRQAKRDGWRRPRWRPLSGADRQALLAQIENADDR